MSSSASGGSTPPKPPKPPSRSGSKKASTASKPAKSPTARKVGQKTPTQCKPLCGHLCAKMPVSVPLPKNALKLLHPTNDVFVLKVAKVGANGDRRCKMEVELVTPKSTLATNRVPHRFDTRDAQCDPCPPCVCQSGPMKPRKRPQQPAKKAP